MHLPDCWSHTLQVLLDERVSWIRKAPFDSSRNDLSQLLRVVNGSLGDSIHRSLQVLDVQRVLGRVPRGLDSLLPSRQPLRLFGQSMVSIVKCT